MTDVKARDYGELAELLDRQCQAYELLLSLSLGQRDAFEKEGPRGLMKMIARKQTVINRLQAIDGSLAGYTTRWEETRRALPGQARKEIQVRLDRIAGLIHAVVESEREMERIVAAARDETAARMRDVSSGLKVARAYETPALASTGRILDGES